MSKIGEIMKIEEIEQIGGVCPLCKEEIPLRDLGSVEDWGVCSACWEKYLEDRDGEPEEDIIAYREIGSGEWYHSGIFFQAAKQMIQEGMAKWEKETE